MISNKDAASDSRGGDAQPGPDNRSWPRRIAVIVVVVAAVGVIGVWPFSRRGPDESAIEMLPSNDAVQSIWPGATVRSRAEDPVHRLYERNSVILSVRLPDQSNLSVRASDYSGKSRAWLVAKAFSPGWNGYYWDYPQRHVADGADVSSLPESSKLVGFECRPAIGTPECRRWILWWKRGYGIWKVSWAPTQWATTTEAVTTLTPVWSN
jgi:hypothetical protein